MLRRAARAVWICAAMVGALGCAAKSPPRWPAAVSQRWSSQDAESPPTIIDVFGSAVPLSQATREKLMARWGPDFLVALPPIKLHPVHQAILVRLLTPVDAQADLLARKGAHARALQLVPLLRAKKLSLFGASDPPIPLAEATFLFQQELDGAQDDIQHAAAERTLLEYLPVATRAGSLIVSMSVWFDANTLAGGGSLSPDLEYLSEVRVAEGARQFCLDRARPFAEHAAREERTVTFAPVVSMKVPSPK